MTMVADASILLGHQLLVEGFPFLSVLIFMGPMRGEGFGGKGRGFHDLCIGISFRLLLARRTLAFYAWRDHARF